MRVVTFGAAALLASALACAGAAPRQPAKDDPIATVAPGVVDSATGKRLAAAGAVVLDVRTPEEYAAGHVQGAVNIPVEQVAARAAELGPPATPIVVYCKSGRRSATAITALREKGYTRLWNAGGYEAWAKDQ